MRASLRVWGPDVRYSLALVFLTTALGIWAAAIGPTARPLLPAVFVFGIAGLGLILTLHPRRSIWVPLGLSLLALAGYAADFPPWGEWGFWGIGLVGWTRWMAPLFRETFRALGFLDPWVYAVPWSMAIVLGFLWRSVWIPTRWVLIPVVLSLGVVAVATYRCSRQWHRLPLQDSSPLIRGGTYFLRPLWRSHALLYGWVVILAAANVWLHRTGLTLLLGLMVTSLFAASVWIAYRWADLHPNLERS